MKIKLDVGAIIPTRGHKTDAGLDVYSRETKVIPARGSEVFDTGVHIELPHGTTGFLKSKSGLNAKHRFKSLLNFKVLEIRKRMIGNDTTRSNKSVKT